MNPARWYSKEMRPIDVQEYLRSFDFLRDSLHIVHIRAGDLSVTLYGRRLPIDD